PTEGHAAGNYDRYGGADESRLYDGGFGRGSAHRGAAPDESFRSAGAGAARADYCGNPHVSHLHGAGDNCPWHHRYSDGTLSCLCVWLRVPTDAPGKNNSGSELKKLKPKNPKQRGRYEYSKRLRNTESSITRGVASRAARPAQSGEGAHEAQR